MLRFRLRTLLIAVAVLAVPMAWVGYSLRWIAERQEWLSSNSKSILDVVKRPSVSAPAGLWLLGESGCPQIVVWEDDEAKRARELFPEASVVTLPTGGSSIEIIDLSHVFLPGPLPAPSPSSARSLRPLPDGK
jgi:hypothetical protein